MDEFSEPVAAAELREFLEADLTGVRAAPAFKRRLRRRLWDLLKARAIQRRAAGESPRPEEAAPESARRPAVR